MELLPFLNKFCKKVKRNRDIKTSQPLQLRGFNFKNILYRVFVWSKLEEPQHIV